MPLIKDTLLSIERTLSGRDWILIVADDGSSDGTVEYLSKYKTGASHYVFKSFQKASYLGEAKNRTFKMAKSFKDAYQAVFVMDADDIMLPSRATDLLSFAVENNYPLVVGSHFRSGQEFSDDGAVYSVSQTSAIRCDYGLWATVFHSSLIPDDGRLFREDVHGYDDGCLNAYWLSKGVVAKPLDKLTHIYRRRRNTVYTPENQELNNQILSKHKDVMFEYFLGKRINFGFDIKVSLFTTVTNEVDIGNFFSNLNHCIRVFHIEPNFEIIIADATSNLTLLSTARYSLAKEIACGIIKIFGSDGNQYKTTKAFIKNAASEQLVYFDPKNFNSFALHALKEKTDSVRSIGKFIVFNKLFLSVQNENSSPV
jgi:glycosyltransferase involved in cell wall biosynthesis